jgi:hypothetical protein
MRTALNVARNIFATGSLALLCLAALPSNARASDLKIEARLIWGTNDEKGAKPEYRKVGKDPAVEELKKAYQWKHYFEVTRKRTTIPSRGTTRLQMSEKCTLEITELEGPKVEVTLIGEGKRLTKVTKQLSKGQSFGMASDLKDGSGWFVLISEVDD